MSIHRLPLLLTALFCAGCSSKPKMWHYEYKPGKTAVLVNGKAVPPAGLPKKVMQAVSAGNRIAGRPYKYGGGHRGFEDAGYDCSGAASYVLHAAGALKSPGTSQSLRSFGKKGEGRHITLYTKPGHHCFLVVAGLRFDTGYNGQRKGPEWSAKSRPIQGYTARHPPGL